MNSVFELQSRIGVHFHDTNILVKALTHSSYFEGQGRKNCYERLEFLGDSVLGLIVSSLLFEKETDFEEGQLTQVRAAIVCETALARAARSLELGQYLRMGRGEEMTGGRERSSILCDVMESVIAAIYLDQGYKIAEQWTLHVLEDIIEDALAGKLDTDSKTKLQEYLQGIGGESATYHLLREDGPPHNRTFTVEVLHDGKQIGTGQGRSKKEAEKEAARQALRELMS